MIHIEFYGSSGSGKSTLYRWANDYLFLKLGYRPGPQLEWRHMLADESIVRYRRPKLLRLASLFAPAKAQHRLKEFFQKDSLDLISQGILANHALLSCYLNQAYHAQPPASQHEHRNMTEQLQGFLALMAYHEAIKKRSGQTVVMYSEGFYQRLARLLVEEAKQGSTIPRTCSANMPDVNLLFYVYAPPEICYRRLCTRPKGFPGTMKHLEPSEMLARLKRSEHLHQAVLAIAADRGTIVKQLDNMTNLKHVLEQLSNDLDQHLSEYSARP